MGYDAAGLHVGHQLLTLQTGRWIAAAAGQAGDECRPLDPLWIQPPRSGVVAHEFRVCLERDERGDLGALAADRRSGAAGRQYTGGREQTGQTAGHSHR